MDLGKILKITPFLTLLYSPCSFSTPVSFDSARVPALETKKVAVISIKEEIDPGLALFLKRAIKEVQDSLNPEVLVFEINTFGGRLDAAFDIVDAISEIKNCSTYAYVKQKAISAGALISLACNRLVMEKGTTIGDCAPIIQGQEGIIMAGEKIESPLRAKFRNLAERNGYPLLLAQGMVSINMHIVEVEKNGQKKYMTQQEWDEIPEKDRKAYSNKKTVINKGELLTMTDTEAETYGFSQGSYESLESLAKEKGWEIIDRKETNWSEELVRAIGKVAPLLMLLGFGALYMEFKTPGFGFFGIAGIVLLLIVFGSKYAAGLADYTELLLLLAGSALIFVEIFVMPGTLIFGGAGIVLIAASLILSLQSFNLPNPDFPWEKKIFFQNIILVLSTALFGLAFPIFGAKYILPRLSGSLKLITSETLSTAHVVSPVEDFSALAVGLRGRTKTALRPVGKVELENHLVEAHALSGFIEANSDVEICGIDGNKITVRDVSA